MQKLKNISVKSATGSNLTPLGMIYCSFELGKIRFHSNLIVCRNLTRPLILGRDLLLQHHITVCYAVDGKYVLDYQQQELVASIDIEDKPQLNITHSVTIPGRTLVIVCIYNNLDPKQSGSLYEIVRWPVFVYCIVGTWVRYGSHMRIRYGSSPIVLYCFLLLWYVTYTLIVTSYYANV